MRDVPTAGPTTAHRLADQLLGERGPLSSFVTLRRAQGRSWRLIARDLHTETQIDVTFETLRSWFPDADRQPEDAA